MSTSRIPHSKLLFFAYMADTDAYLLVGTIPNWQRMNWLTAEQAQWHTYATQAAAFAILWANKSNRTEPLKINIDNLISLVHKFDHENHLLDRIAAQSPTLALIEDFITFNIAHNMPVPNSGNATQRQVATENIVYFSVINGAAGQLICHCKPNESSKRNHLLKGYNVEIFYEILPQNAPNPNIDQLTEHEVFSKSYFTLNLGGTYSGQKLFIGMRWRHKTNPALNGSIGVVQSITIS
jgi:hypothetical protein